MNTLQSCLTDVVRNYSDVQFEIRCDLSKHVLSALRSNEIDIAVALFDGDDQQFLFRNWKEQPTWVGAVDFDIPNGSNIPLVVHPYGCVYRDRMATALKLAGKKLAYCLFESWDRRRSTRGSRRIGPVLSNSAHRSKRYAQIQ
ncbi:hypothetical protein [Planktomarina sp.]|uniref:hypothetical protein n=1 Tax=Planktomarina sp. TaxID=2024851 RepID=UPI0032604300